MTRIFTYIKYEIKIFRQLFKRILDDSLSAFTPDSLTIAFSNLRFRELDLEKASIAYDEEAFMSTLLRRTAKEFKHANA